MHFIFSAICVIISLVLFFRALLKQSKRPSGIVGKWMMKLWNKVYIPMVRWSVSFIPKNEQLSILDIGIGNGASTRILAELFPNSKVFGIDLSEEAIKQVQYQTHSQNQNIFYEQMDVQKMSFDVHQFDLIFAFQTHFHWDNFKKSLSEIKRTLKIDGYLIIACEWAKINYYLPEIVDASDFERYLESLDLKLHQLEKHRGWIFYKIGFK